MDNETLGRFLFNYLDRLDREQAQMIPPIQNSTLKQKQDRKMYVTLPLSDYLFIEEQAGLRGVSSYALVTAVVGDWCEKERSDSSSALDELEEEADKVFSSPSSESV